MSGCPNCTCDNCYFEFHDVLGPISPRRCYQCRTVLAWGTDQQFCQECLAAVVRRFYAERLDNKPQSDCVISANEHQRMLKEMQE